VEPAVNSPSKTGSQAHEKTTENKIACEPLFLTVNCYQAGSAAIG